MLQLHSQMFPTPQFFLECFDFSGEKGTELTLSHFPDGIPGHSPSEWRPLVGKNLVSRCLDSLKHQLSSFLPSSILTPWGNRGLYSPMLVCAHTNIYTCVCVGGNSHFSNKNEFILYHYSVYMLSHLPPHLNPPSTPPFLPFNFTLLKEISFPLSISPPEATLSRLPDHSPPTHTYPPR